jgi:hypothetical protein
MRDTWYVLEDGSSADPREVSPDGKGVLRAKSGAAVAVGDHGNPRTRGVEVDEKGAEVKQKAPAKDRQVKSGGDEKDPSYKTR